MTDNVIRSAPLYEKVLRGDKLTFGEWLRFYVLAALMKFAWRTRVTPALRERCVGHAVRSRAANEVAITTRAEALAEYIVSGRTL